jgi:uncharacterized YkwD family protein/spore coat assembly protein SafA
MEVCMIKKAKYILAILVSIITLSTAASAADVAKHTVISGESLWRIAVKYQVGVDEIINANPQIKNPDMIYPGQVITVPLIPKAVTDYENEVIRLTNQFRVQNGLSALKENWELSRVARFKSQDMHDRGYFDHYSPTYGTFSNMIKNFGIPYRSAGENIAQGYSTPYDVVTGWKNSPGHRANMLGSSFKQIGLGYVPDGRYWTMELIG